MIDRIELPIELCLQIFDYADVKTLLALRLSSGFFNVLATELLMTDKKTKTLSYQRRFFQYIAKTNNTKVPTNRVLRHLKNKNLTLSDRLIDLIIISKNENINLTVEQNLFKKLIEKDTHTDRQIEQKLKVIAAVGGQLTLQQISSCLPYVFKCLFNPVKTIRQSAYNALEVMQPKFSSDQNDTFNRFIEVLNLKLASSNWQNRESLLDMVCKLAPILTVKQTTFLYPTILNSLARFGETTRKVLSSILPKVNLDHEKYVAEIKAQLASKDKERLSIFYILEALAPKLTSEAITAVLPEIMNASVKLDLRPLPQQILQVLLPRFNSQHEQIFLKKSLALLRYHSLFGTVETNENMLSHLAILAPQLSPKLTNAIYPEVQNCILEDKHGKTAAKTLAALLPKTDLTLTHEFLEKIKVKLAAFKHPGWLAPVRLFESLNEFVSKLPATEITFILPSLLTCLFDEKDNTSQVTVAKIMLTLIPDLTPEHIATCIIAVRVNLDNNHILISHTLFILKQLTAHLTPEDMTFILPTILKNLSDPDAAEILRAIHPRFNGEHEEMMGHFLKEMRVILEKEDESSFASEIKKLARLLPILDPTQMAIFQSVLSQLSESDQVGQQAFETLAAMLLKLPTPQIEVFLKEIPAKLHSKQWRIPELTLQVLAKLAPKLSAPSISTILPDLFACLVDNNVRLRQGALEALAPLVSTFSSDQRKAYLQAIRNQFKNNKKLNGFLKTFALVVPKLTPEESIDMIADTMKYVVDNYYVEPQIAVATLKLFLSSCHSDQLKIFLLEAKEQLNDHDDPYRQISLLRILTSLLPLFTKQHINLILPSIHLFLQHNYPDICYEALTFLFTFWAKFPLEQTQIFLGPLISLLHSYLPVRRHEALKILSLIAPELDLRLEKNNSLLLEILKRLNNEEGYIVEEAENLLSYFVLLGKLNAGQLKGHDNSFANSELIQIFADWCDQTKQVENIEQLSQENLRPQMQLKR